MIKNKLFDKKSKKKNNSILKDKFTKFNKNDFHTTEVIFLLVLTAIISLIVGYLLNYKKEEKITDTNLNKIIDNYNYIVDNYYEDVDKAELAKGAVKGMLSSLGDEYSELLEQDDNRSFYINLEGTYDGIGIEIYNDENNNIVVLGIIENSPAEKAGLQIGDIIKQIDDKSLENTNIKELTNYVQENKNDTYNLIVVRNGEEMNITIERQTITIKSVSSKVIERDNKKIGYIYISVFANATGSQFKKALQELENQNIDSLIIDVRNNTGGHLTTAVSILSNLLDSKKVIYQIEKNKKTTKYYSSGTVTKTYPIVVLQNGNSASASELLSSALKESYGATIVGEKSYGKGTVQELVDLGSDDNYKFTTKKWLTPNGNSINKEGVKPDIEVTLSEEYSANPSDDNDNQLQEAINYLLK